MGVGGHHHAPAALPPGKTRYPLYRRLGRPQGWSGEVQKISLPPGFNPQTVQPVASRYTDCANSSSKRVMVIYRVVENGGMISSDQHLILSVRVFIQTFYTDFTLHTITTTNDL